MTEVTDTQDVYLDICNWYTTDDGFKPVQAEGSDVYYSFKYTGGINGKGKVVEIVDGVESRIKISMVADKRYIITDVYFDKTNGLNATVDTDYEATIIDADKVKIKAEYTVVVKDTNTQLTIKCDPPIRNKAT